MYKCVVRPAIMYGMETVAVTDKQVGKLEVAELKMVRWALGVTREDKIRNEYIRGTARIAKLGEKIREDKIRNEYIRGTARIAKLGEKIREARLQWYGHVKRREAEYVGRRTLEMEVPGRRKRGRPRKRWLDVVREDMESVGVVEEDVVKRGVKTHCGDPELGKPKGKEEDRTRNF